MNIPATMATVFTSGMFAMVQMTVEIIQMSGFVVCFFFSIVSLFVCFFFFLKKLLISIIGSS